MNTSFLPLVHACGAEATLVTCDQLQNEQKLTVGRSVKMWFSKGDLAQKRSIVLELQIEGISVVTSDQPVTEIFQHKKEDVSDHSPTRTSCSPADMSLNRNVTSSPRHFFFPRLKLPLLFINFY